MISISDTLQAAKSELTSAFDGTLTDTNLSSLVSNRQKQLKEDAKIQTNTW
jgi:hypothetical protein